MLVSIYLWVIILSFFSILLFQDNIKKGRTDIKVSENQALVHIIIFSALKNCKYDIQFFIGKNGEDKIQKGYIITDNFGNFNNTIRFNKKSEINIKNFDKISLIVLTPDNNSKKDCQILGFRHEKYDFQNNNFKIKNINKNQDLNQEGYEQNKEYDSVINNTLEYWPFSTRINDMKTVKINENIFKKLNFNFVKDSIKEYALNSLKFYNFLLFGRCIRNKRVIYILGIPDKFNDCQVISMANMGAKKFYALDMMKTPQNGDLGFWVIFV